MKCNRTRINFNFNFNCRLFSSNSNSNSKEISGGLIIKQAVKPSDLSIKYIHPADFGTIPRLSHGLDRVLFNPGVHYLRDFRTNVYNYDPYLRNICQPDEFNFDSIPKFIPPSQDKSLQSAASKYQSKFVSSTSSIAPSMSHLYFLISGLRPMDLSNRFTGCFEDEPQTFTQMCRSPLGVYIRPHTTNSSGNTIIRSLVAEKGGVEEEKPTILMQLGNVLEKALTHPKQDFERMLKGVSDPYIPKEEETYNYLQASSFLLRSQLDCQDPRLPKKAFDIKTRATLPIRMDVNNYSDYLSYKLHRPFGLYESFEREFFDLCRSGLLKYNFQVRIGDMDGILIAYHNTAELFGFQYLTRAEMDEILYGNGVTGDAVFKVVLRVYEQVLQAITALYKDTETVRLSFSLNKDGSKLTIFSEVVNEEDDLANNKYTASFNQFCLSVSNHINGFRSDNITLNPSGMDDWRLDYTLQQQKPNVAEYESARRKITEGRSRTVDKTTTTPSSAFEKSPISVPIMRNARRMNPVTTQFPDGSEIIAPWTSV